MPFKTHSPENGSLEPKQSTVPHKEFKGAYETNGQLNFIDVNDKGLLQGGEEITHLSQIQMIEWNEAFPKLRPPPKMSKKKPLQSGEKLMTRTCEQIVEFITSFADNHPSLNKDMGRTGDVKNLFKKNVVAVRGETKEIEPTEYYNAYGETPIPYNLILSSAK